MNCDPIARWYCALEYGGMGRALERRRFEFLPLLTAQVAPNPVASVTDRRALLLGDGDGRFLVALLEANPGVRVDYVDNSARMLVVARQRAVDRLGADTVERNVVFIQADARQFQPAPGRFYDLVATHFFLDCLTTPEVETLLLNLKPFFSKQTVWIVSEFNQPRGGWRAWRARLWIGGLYRAFGWLTGLKVRRLPDHRSVFAAQGFGLKKSVVGEWGLLVSEWWEREP